MTYEIHVTKQKRKTLKLSVRQAGIVDVAAPIFMTEAEIRQELLRHEKWIQKQLTLVKAREEAVKSVQPLTREEIRALADTAVEKLPVRIAYWAEKIGVRYGRVTIRMQKTRWGSCSQQGNLNFNCLLMLLPETIWDYVIVHELCHRIEMNHSARFWHLVSEQMPDYQTRRQQLKALGREAMMRAFG